MRFEVSLQLWFQKSRIFSGKFGAILGGIMALKIHLENLIH